MNTDHIKTVFREYLVDPYARYALLINGPWGSGKTFFWEKELKPLVEGAGKQPLYLSLNGISSRAVLEQQLFIRMWKFLNRGESPRKTQFLQLLGNAASALAKKKLDMNLPELLRGLALESGINDQYLLCFDDLERCQLALPEILGFINDYVEHHELKALILSDESRIHTDQPDFAGIKEKVIGRTFNFRPDHAAVLPQLIKRYAADPDALLFLQSRESFICELLTAFQEDNLRIIDSFLAASVRLLPFLKDRNEDLTREVLLFTLAISIEHKRGALASADAGDYKNLSILEMAAQQTSRPGEDTTLQLPDYIKEDYPRRFFTRYLKGQSRQFYLWKPVFDFILSGYLDTAALEADLDGRDTDKIPDHLSCFPRLINYHFRHLDDQEFAELVKKVADYAEQGLYQIYDYLQIADFYFYFADQGLITAKYERILDMARKGLGKAAKRGETNDEVYGNMMHFQKDNEESEKFKEEVANVHIDIIRRRRAGVMKQLGKHIEEGQIDQITRLFHEHRADPDFFPAAQMDDFCKIIQHAPNRSLSQIARIFSKRYNTGLCQLLTGDAEPLRVLDSHIDMELLIGYSGLRRFVLTELSKTVKDGLACVDFAKKNPLRAKKQ